MRNDRYIGYSLVAELDSVETHLYRDHYGFERHYSHFRTDDGQFFFMHSRRGGFGAERAGDSHCELRLHVASDIGVQPVERNFVFRNGVGGLMAGRQGFLQ